MPYLCEVVLHRLAICQPCQRRRLRVERQTRISDHYSRSERRCVEVVLKYCILTKSPSRCILLQISSALLEDVAAEYGKEEGAATCIARPLARPSVRPFVRPSIRPARPSVRPSAEQLSRQSSYTHGVTIIANCEVAFLKRKGKRDLRNAHSSGEDSERTTLNTSSIITRSSHVPSFKRRMGSSQLHNYRSRTIVRSSFCSFVHAPIRFAVRSPSIHLSSRTS